MTLKMLDFDHLIYVGLRDMDDFERQLIEEKKIKCFTPAQAIDFMDQNKNIPIHVTLNVDALDASYISSTGMAC